MGAPVRIGEVLADKYTVTRILGVGGMGVVVEARHGDLDKLVALKFIHEEISSNLEVTERFLREARAAARLQNEHVVRVLDVGRLANNAPYIVMEYLAGQDLGQHLESHGALEVSDAAEYILQVCEAMAEAHAQGIVHRDLKPQNLFLTTRQDGRPLVKVLDFGISKALFSPSSTHTSQAVGSPAYMAPEQIQSSRSVDARADIWSLGVILYQLLTNTLPFGGDTPLAVMFNAVLQSAPPLTTLRNGLPTGLVSAVERCLEKDRERRFSSIAELAHELVPYTPERARAAISLIEHVMAAGVHHSELSTQGPGLSTHPTDEVPGQCLTDMPLTRTTLGAATSSISVERRARRRWPWVAALGTVVAMAAVVAVMSNRGSESDATSAESAQGTRPASATSASAFRNSETGDVHPDAAITTHVAPAIDARTSSVVDSMPDAGVEESSRSKREIPSTSRTTQRTVPRDADVSPSSESEYLEPARTDDKPLSPAR